jgi:uncharacterized protein
MTEILFNELYKDVMKMLREQLPENLFYHSPEHTADVIASAERTARSEQCTPHETMLLKMAALFHDTGYTRDMREHEKHGCDIAAEILQSKNINQEDISVICGLIMATKVPQMPVTRLQEIICDADLDYLGREDYFTIAESLHREFIAFEKVKNEKDWMQLQLNFLQSHRYFTQTCIRSRQPGADENLKKIRDTVIG